MPDIRSLGLKLAAFKPLPTPSSKQATDVSTPRLATVPRPLRRKEPRSARRKTRRPGARRPGAWRFALHLTLRAVPYLFIVLLGALGGLVYALNAPPVYTATAHVIVVPTNSGPDRMAVNFAQAYGRLAAKRQTLAWAVDPVPPSRGADAPKHVKASTSPDTPLIQLTGSARTAERAVQYADAAADALVRYGTSLSGETGVRVAFMSPADRPTRPTSPDLPLSLAVGTAAGVLLAGLAGAIASGIRGQFREYRRLHSEEPRPSSDTGPEPPVDASTAPRDDNTSAGEVPTPTRVGRATARQRHTPTRKSRKSRRQK